MNTPVAATHRHWSREPMVWLVWGLPACVVVAGFITLGIAIRSGADGSADPVHRMAQVQQTDISADRAANARGLSASLSLHHGHVDLQVLGGIDASGELLLRFEHPSQAGLDHSVDLHWQDDRWRADLDLPPAARWHVTLQPRDGSWRLDGELSTATGIAVLQPRFGNG